MGKTMSEKMIARAAGLSEVSAGEIHWVNVDRAMMDDILGPRVQIAERMKELNATVWDVSKTVIISDHYTPPANAQQAQIVKFTRDWAEEYGIDNYFEFEGPCHQVMVEQGHVRPGYIILGTDSHTCMGGAFGAFASGVGSTEMLGILVTGQTWLKVPETIKVTWQNDLPLGSMAKDLTLRTIKDIGHAGATYKAIEFGGSTIKNLSTDERLSISNMAVEMGAKVGLIEADEKVRQYLVDHGVAPDDVALENLKALAPDEDAAYCASYTYDAQNLVPQVALPHNVDNVYDITDVPKLKIHQAYVGSCTGGRYTDILMAARLLKGRKVAKGVRLLVSPTSREVWRRADKEGLLDILTEAGAVILAPTCGVCVGLHSGILASEERCISSSNRNFMGRMGSKGAEIILGSPLSVAAAAITGYVTDPREFL